MSSVARKRITLALALLTLLAVVAGLIAWYEIARSPHRESSGPAGAPGGVAGGSGGSGGSASFVIDGIAATPISPGVSVPLDLGFTNPYRVPMSITGLQVQIRAIVAPHADDAHQCLPGDFTVGQAVRSPGLRVAPGVRSSLSSLGLPMADWPHVGMLDRLVNQDGCKGASLTLAYAASATASP